MDGGVEYRMQKQGGALGPPSNQSLLIDGCCAVSVIKIFDCYLYL